MSRIIPINPENPDPCILSEAASLIRKGGLVAYPTDTTYGIAADPFNEKAVSRIFKAKRRPASKPILLLTKDMHWLHSLVGRLSPIEKEVIKRFWPGPLSLVFKASSKLSPSLTAGTGKIGFRIPAEFFPIALIQSSGFPLTATSANLSGLDSPVTAREVAGMIGDELDLILDGGICDSLPSTLLDLSEGGPRILRAGKLPTEKLEEFFKIHNMNLEHVPPETP